MLFRSGLDAGGRRVRRLAVPVDRRRGHAQGIYQGSMSFAILAAGIWGGALWSSGSTQPVLVVAAIGAIVGALYLFGTFLTERLAHRK